MKKSDKKESQTFEINAIELSDDQLENVNGGIVDTLVKGSVAISGPDTNEMRGVMKKSK